MIAKCQYIISFFANKTKGRYLFMAYDEKDIIRRILALKNSAGITNKDLESKIGIASGSIWKWENGKSKPGVTSIIKLAEFFNVSTDYLLGLTSIPISVEQTAPSTLDEDDQRILALYHKLGFEGKTVIQATLISESRRMALGF